MDSILEKIRKIEALIARSGSDGERLSAIQAKERLTKRNAKSEKEFKIYCQDRWHKKLFLALCRKHDLKPYRYYRQKYTTVIVRISEDFLNNVVWQEYMKYSDLLEDLINDVADDIISKIHRDEEEIIIAGNIE